MKMIIGGQKTDAFDQNIIEIINPANHEVIDRVPSATKEDLERSFRFCSERQERMG